MTTERVEILPKELDGANNVTALFEERELLYVQIVHPEGKPPYFQAQWPLNVSLQEAMVYIRGSYHRLNQAYPDRHYQRPEVGHAEIVLDGDHDSVLDLESFLSPKPVFNSCTKESTDSVAVFTPHFNYFIEGHGTVFIVEGREKLSKEIIFLLMTTSKVGLTSIEQTGILGRLNTVYGNLPHSIPKGV